MSLIYSKNQLKLAYKDPEGTIKKFSVFYNGGLSQYSTKIYNIVMYITNNSVILRNMYDPDKLKYNIQNAFFLSINYNQIVHVKVDGVPIQFIDIDNINHLMSCNLSITFMDKDHINTVVFNFSRFLANTKKIILAREIINSFYNTPEFCNLFPKKLPLFKYRVFCKTILPHKDISCEMLTFDDGIFIGSKDGNSVNMYINLKDIMLCKRIVEFQKSYYTINQIVWFTIRFKTESSEETVVFSSASAKFGADIELEILLNKIGIKVDDKR